MVSRLALTRFLNKELNNKPFVDSSKNGMQVIASDKVTKVGLAVDASLTTFQAAKKEKVDFLIVHHGLLWDGKGDMTGVLDKRIAYLKRNKISLYGCHLPLDAHPKLGNNIGLANILGLDRIQTFGNYHGIEIGMKGILPAAMDLHQLKRIIDRKVKTKSTVLPFGKKRIKKIGIVSGGGAGSLVEAVETKMDCLLVGEAAHHVHHQAKDLKMNVIIAGHYETETLGVKSVGRLIEERYGVPAVFLDVPTII